MKCFVCERGRRVDYLCEQCKKDEKEYYENFDAEMRKHERYPRLKILWSLILWFFGKEQ